MFPNPKNDGERSELGNCVSRNWAFIFRQSLTQWTIPPSTPIPAGPIGCRSLTATERSTTNRCQARSAFTRKALPRL